MPQFSMQAAAARGGDDDDDDDSRSMRSSYSTQSYNSHASLSGIFLGGNGARGRRKYVVTKDGPKTITPAPAAHGTTQHQAPSGEGKSKNARKRKNKKKGGKEIEVVVPTRDSANPQKVVTERIPVNKEKAPENISRSVKELKNRLDKIWTELKSNPAKYGGNYKSDDDLVRTFNTFAESGDQLSPTEIAADYNNCIGALVRWQIKLKEKTAKKYESSNAGPGHQ